MSLASGSDAGDVRVPYPYSLSAFGAAAWTGEPSFHEVFSFLHVDDAQGEATPPPLLDSKMHEASKGRICSGLVPASPDTFPYKIGCPGGFVPILFTHWCGTPNDERVLESRTGADGLYRGAPFSMPPDHSLAIVSIEDAIWRVNGWLDNPNPFNPAWTTNEIYSSTTGNVLSIWPNPAWYGRPEITFPDLHIRASASFEELAVVGGTCWDGTQGHFIQETLGRMLLLDALLPCRIPLVVTLDSAITNPAVVAVVDLIRNLGGFRGRQLVTNFSKGAAFVKRLYFVSSQTLSETVFLGSAAGYWGQIHVGAAFMGDWFRRAFHSRAMVKAGGTLCSSRPSNRISLLLREASGARGWVNEDEVVRAIAERFNCTSGAAATRDERCRPVAIVKSLGYEGQHAARSRVDLALLGDEMYDTCILIASHGAAFNNIALGMRPGCAVVEILPTTGFFSMFFSLARNLGLQHWTAYAKEGKQDEPLLIDIQELLDIIDASLASTRKVGYYFDCDDDGRTTRSGNAVIRPPCSSDGGQKGN